MPVCLSVCLQCQKENHSIEISLNSQHYRCIIQVRVSSTQWSGKLVRPKATHQQKGSDDAGRTKVRFLCIFFHFNTYIWPLGPYKRTIIMIQSLHNEVSKNVDTGSWHLLLEFIYLYMESLYDVDFCIRHEKIDYISAVSWDTCSLYYNEGPKKTLGLQTYVTLQCCNYDITVLHLEGRGLNFF